MAVYAGFIEHCDRQIGRVLDRLRDKGLLDNSIVILLSDNGAASEAGQQGFFDGLYRHKSLSPAAQPARIDVLGTAVSQRSAAGRGGDECVSSCRSGSWPFLSKKKKK